MTTTQIQASYDAIVLGGGDNGLLCAAYLAKSGASTLLLERKREWDIGGNLRTEEFQGPYRFNLLPPYMLMLGERAPCYEDLELAGQSLAYITPPVQIAFHHLDGRALVLHRDPQLSAEAIARFCAADAPRFLAMYAQFRSLCEEILLPALYSAEGDAGVARQLDVTPLGRELAQLAAMSPIEIIDGCGYESPHVREAMLYLATFWGLDPRQAGVGQLCVLWMYCQLNAALPKSGNLAVAKALHHAFLEQGGACPVDVRVERILVAQGKAVGVRLSDGREIRARAIVSTLDAQDTFLQLVGEASLSSGLAGACRDWQWQDNSLMSCHFGYKGEAPRYHAARYDAAADQAYVHVFGVERRGDVEAMYRSIAKGMVPEGHGRAICATQFDEFHAGFAHIDGPLQTLRFEVPVPCRLAGRGWDEVRAQGGQAALALWRRYAEQVADGTVSYARVVTPPDLQRSLPCFKHGSFAGGAYTPARAGYHGNRPVCSAYRSEIPGLYMGGASTDAGGLIHLAAGYNAAGLVAHDLFRSKC